MINEKELVSTYCKIAKNNRMAFIIQGDVSWDSQSKDWICHDGICLKSNLYHHEIKLENRVSCHRELDSIYDFLQREMNIYEILGYITVDINKHNPEDIQNNIEDGIKKIHRIINELAFFLDSSLRWYPAEEIDTRKLVENNGGNNTIEYKPIFIRHPRVAFEEMSQGIRDEKISEIFNFHDKISNLSPEIRDVLLTSIEYFNQANHMTSWLSKFVNYWASVELLATYFYNSIHAGKLGKKTSEEKRIEIEKILSGLSFETCFKKIIECNKIINPPIKKKIELFFDVLYTEEESEFRQTLWERLFKKDKIYDLSLYEFRNKMAHGSMGEWNLDIKSNISYKILDAQLIANHIIEKTIENADKLAYIQKNQK